ncbi:MAG: succinyl-diaminopimelate desuccinylase [Aquificae bacterium]|nr:succinyl-diaminopimelate desuccinylase [Aquificota bacterium]
MEDKLIEYLVKLVNIPSVIGNEKQIADFVEGFARSLGYSYVRHNNSLIVYKNENRLTDYKKTVGLLGHLDTVPGENDFNGKIIDDKVYGLGASDMKSGLAVMMALMEMFKDKDSRYDLVFIFYEKEEGPYEENGLEPLLDYPLVKNLDFVFALEPTDNTVQVGCLGTLHASIVFEGKRAHSARPWQGENAIHKASDFLKRLSNYGFREYEFEGVKYIEVMNATMVDFSGGRNIIPDKFVINVNYRFSPGKTIEQAKKDIFELVNGDAKVEFTDLCPSGKVCLDNPVLVDFLKKFELPVEPKQAWTDVARLSVHGIDAVNFGPGLPSQAHQKNEYVPIGNVVKNFKIFDKFFS